MSEAGDQRTTEELIEAGYAALAKGDRGAARALDAQITAAFNRAYGGMPVVGRAGRRA